MTPWMCSILRVMSSRVRAPHTVVISPTAMYGSIICGPPPSLHSYSLMDVRPRQGHDSDGRPGTTRPSVSRSLTRCANQQVILLYGFSGGDHGLTDVLELD